MQVVQKDLMSMKVTELKEELEARGELSPEVSECQRCRRCRGGVEKCREVSRQCRGGVN
jgi:hypothetical protein